MTVPTPRPKPSIVRRTATPKSLIPIIEPSSPRVRAMPRTQPRVPVAPRTQPHAAPQEPIVNELPVRAYVALSDDLAVEAIEPHKAAFFDSLAKVKAVTMVVPKPQAMTRALDGSGLAHQRDYDREDLFAVAEIGYHYLMNGGVKLAITLFEGLTAVAPREPYFALALGLSFDHQGDKADAMRWYDKAAALDPFDPRPDLNRAELLVEAREFHAAKDLLKRAAAKAQKKGDMPLHRKATAILAHVSRAA